MNSIIDAELVQAQKEKDIREPLTYDDIKDDPYYYHSPEPEEGSK
jgi:hypothetical protein